MWSLIFYLGRAQPPLSVVLLLLSRSVGPQGTNSNCLPWGPICLLSQNDFLFCVYFPCLPTLMTAFLGHQREIGQGVRFLTSQYAAMVCYCRSCPRYLSVISQCFCIILLLLFLGEDICRLSRSLMGGN